MVTPSAQRAFPEARGVPPIVNVSDVGYAAFERLSVLVPTVTWVVRLGLDAQLFAPLLSRQAGTSARSRASVARLPKASTVLADATTDWQHLTIAGWQS